MNQSPYILVDLRESLPWQGEIGIMHTPELDPLSPARKFSFEQWQMLILLDPNDMACAG